MILSLEDSLLNAAASLESTNADSRLAAVSSISQLVEQALYHQTRVSSDLMVTLAHLLVEECLIEVDLPIRYAELDALSGLSSLSAFCGLSLNLQKLAENVNKFNTREKEPIALSLGYTKNSSYGRVLNELAKEDDEELNGVVAEALKELNYNPSQF